MQEHTRWSEKERQILARMAEKGHSFREIAGKLKRSMGSVKSKAAREGIVNNGIVTLSEAQQKEVLYMYRGGVPIADIAEKIDKSVAATRVYIYRKTEFRREPNWREDEIGERRTKNARKIRKHRLKSKK